MNFPESKCLPTCQWPKGRWIHHLAKWGCSASSSRHRSVFRRAAPCGCPRVGQPSQQQTSPGWTRPSIWYRSRSTAEKTHIPDRFHHLGALLRPRLAPLSPARETASPRCCRHRLPAVLAPRTQPGAPAGCSQPPEGCRSHSGHTCRCPCGSKCWGRSSRPDSHLCVCWWCDCTLGKKAYAWVFYMWHRTGDFKAADRKCNLVHGCGVSPERIQSSLVPWSQNSWTCARPRDRNFSTMDCSLAVLVLSSSRISLLSLTGEHETSRQYQHANPSCWLRFWGGGLFSYFLALLLFSRLLIEEAFDLHVQMRRLVFAAPALLLSAAPWSRSPHQRRVGSRRQRGGVRWRARALNRGWEAWGSFMGCLFFCFSFYSSTLATGHRPDHGP